MARAALLLVLAFAGAALAQDACLLVAKVDTKASPYVVDGSVSKPVKGVMPNVKVAAEGFIYVRLPEGTACPPTFETSAALSEALAASRFVAPEKRRNVAFAPKDIKSKVTNPANNKTIANWDLLAAEFGLFSNAPLGAAVATPAGASDCTQVLFVNGSLSLDSPIVGARTAALSPIAQNHTMDIIATIDAPAGKPPAKVTFKVKNAMFAFDISPEKTPGVHSTTMVTNTKGDLVAVADLADKATFVKVPTQGLDWNARPRIWQPTVVAPCDPNGLLPVECENPEPAYVPAEGAPGFCQVSASAAKAPASAAKPGAKSAAAGRGAAGALVAAVAAAAAVLAL